MSEPKFKVGQAVKLSSGGPTMTITNIISGDFGHFYVCAYFHEGQLIVLTDTKFPEACIG